ncbi:MAG: hypothetical protein IPL09_01635 [Bacteroidetes bacterium]|nr:hypothetical protein [Bacteroidota bacterium]
MQIQGELSLKEILSIFIVKHLAKVVYSFQYVYFNSKFNLVMNYNYSVAARFMRYVQVDTQSDPNATCFPSTEKQKDLARILAKS